MPIFPESLPARMQAFPRSQLERRSYPDWRDPPRGCDECGSIAVSLQGNEHVYRRPLGDWPYVYLCGDCRAYVGLHPFSLYPLGTMADARTRAARLKLHEVFDPLWKNRPVSRRQAYRELALAMGVKTCHISEMSSEDCLQALAKIDEIAARLTA